MQLVARFGVTVSPEFTGAMSPLSRIVATSVRRWAEQLDARYGLRELGWRLVRETSMGPVDVQFATDEGFDLGRFDGTVQAGVGSRWVPYGCSVSEGVDRTKRRVQS